MSDQPITRRKVVGITGAFLAGCSLKTEPVSTTTSGSTTQTVSSPDAAVRWAPANELISTLEFEDQARRVLSESAFRAVAGSSRDAFDRMTLRPRMNIPTTQLDLGVTLFGQELFTPIIIGPIAQQRNYHADGELAMVRGAADAYTSVVVSSDSSVPFADVAAQASTPLWFSVYAQPDAPELARAAVAAGAKAVFVTVGASPTGGSTAPMSRAVSSADWRVVDSIRQNLSVPVVVKGIRTIDDAGMALLRNVDGIVVSNNGSAPGVASGIEYLEAIADLTAGRAEVLVDGSFRRGTDVIKALILGARAVLISRPAAWGLAAYGPEGVRFVVEVLQNELGRCVAMIGAVAPNDLTRNHIRMHSRATS